MKYAIARWVDWYSCHPSLVFLGAHGFTRNKADALTDTREAAEAIFRDRYLANLVSDCIIVGIRDDGSVTEAINA